MNSVCLLKFPSISFSGCSAHLLNNAVPSFASILMNAVSWLKFETKPWTYISFVPHRPSLSGFSDWDLEVPTLGSRPLIRCWRCNKKCREINCLWDDPSPMEVSTGEREARLINSNFFCPHWGCSEVYFLFANFPEAEETCLELLAVSLCCILWSGSCCIPLGCSVSFFTSFPPFPQPLCPWAY